MHINAELVNTQMTQGVMCAGATHPLSSQGQQSREESNRGGGQVAVRDPTWGH